jgi:hypothetical protein
MTRKPNDLRPSFSPEEAAQIFHLTRTLKQKIDALVAEGISERQVVAILRAYSLELAAEHGMGPDELDAWLKQARANFARDYGPDLGGRLQ